MNPQQYPTRRRPLGFAAALLLVIGLAGLADAAATGPTVAELLRVCDRAFAQGYTGIDAATCEWYAAPCACKLRDPDGGGLPWCIPDSESIDATVRKVVETLRLSPSPDAPAETAVHDILKRLYPCAERPPPGE